MTRASALVTAVLLSGCTAAHVVPADLIAPVPSPDTAFTVPEIDAPPVTVARIPELWKETAVDLEMPLSWEGLACGGVFAPRVQRIVARLTGVASISTPIDAALGHDPVYVVYHFRLVHGGP